MNNSKIPQSISFDKTNLKLNIDNWNNKHNKNLDKWLNEGKMIQIDKELFLETNYFNTIKEQLNQFYKIVDLELIKFNPDLRNEILYFCAIKQKEISNLIIQYSKPFETRIKLLNSFKLLCKTIIQQPVIILEAIKEYNYSDNNKTIYYRYKYINDKIDFSKSKFRWFKIGVDKIIHEILAERLSNKPIQNLFIFTEQFINELTSDKPFGINYFIKSSLFAYFFTTILSYKKKYISVFENFEYENIEKLEKEFNNNLTDNQKHILTGFKTTLTKQQQGKLYKALQNNYIDCTETQFKAMFTNNSEPLKWKATNILLAYFVSNCKKITDNNKWKKASQIFSTKNNLQQSLNNNPYPKGYEKIESIINSIE